MKVILSQMKMKHNYKDEKLRNTENSKIKKFETFEISIFRIYSRLKKRLKYITKALIL